MWLLPALLVLAVPFALGAVLEHQHDAVDWSSGTQALKFYLGAALLVGAAVVVGLAGLVLATVMGIRAHRQGRIRRRRTPAARATTADVDTVAEQHPPAE